MKLDWNYHRLGDKIVRKEFSKSVSEDPSFFQLDTFYNEDLVLSHINPPLQKAGWPWAKSFQILKVGYLCTKRLMVIYHLRHGLADDDHLILVVHFFKKTMSHSGYQKINATALNQNAVIHIPEWRAVATVFPEDPDLPTLRNMLDPDKISQSLGHLSEAIDREKISWDLMSYQQGKRCTIRYQVLNQHFICKLGKEGISHRTHEWMKQLWIMPDRHFRMPQPIGLDEKDGRRWESYLEGKSIDLNIPKLDLSSRVKALSSGMVQLHKISLKGLRPLGVTQILQEMERKIVRKLCRSLLPLTIEIESYFKILVIKSASILPEPSVTLHGDAHSANILFDGDQLAFIDLDALVLGNPAYDLVRFGNRLLLMALMRNERVEEMIRLLASLPEAYENAGGKHISPDVFAWYVSALLVGKELMACIKNRASDLGRLAPLILDIAQKTLYSGKVCH